MAYAVMGDVYIDPETAGSGGTLLRGLDPARPVRLIPPNRVVEGRAGGGDDDITTMRMPGGRWLLELPIIAGNATAVRLALSTFTSDGAEGSSMPLATDGVALLVRPRNPSERYWFMPAARLSSESDVMMHRSRVALTELDESRVVLVCQRKGGARGVTWGNASAIDEAIDEAGGNVMRTIRKVITRSEIVALGAVQAGQISMGVDLPAGAIPVGWVIRNRGTAFTSSAGPIAVMTATIVASGQTVGAISDPGTAEDMMVAGRRAGAALGRGSTTPVIAPWPNSAWTPHVRLVADQDFDSFENGDDGIEVIIMYQSVVL